MGHLFENGVGHIHENKVGIFLENLGFIVGHIPENSQRLYRFRDGQQAEVVLKAKVGDGGIINKGYIPRVGDEIGAEIYKKLMQIQTKVGDYSIDSEPDTGNSIWFHSVGRYWLTAYNFLPYFSRAGKKGISTKLFKMNMASKDAALATIGLINSNLFYFWWMLQSDEFDLLLSQILSFPFKPSLIGDNNLQKAVDALMEDYKSKAIRKVINAGGNRIEMDEIHARLSRDYIRNIDKCLAEHYQLGTEEIAYLDTYDEEFRTSEE